ncbi:hypothetical protein LWI29_024832 [Acer saccharum]|uniref:Integrase catalytic domain-containing protein n=1 Tax=Acer saccharum TaxID=4024 RepID=A0AA39SHR5_ACESA|nr:hypothetical protein LWI29_024832 [Acer saccharum]
MEDKLKEELVLSRRNEDSLKRELEEVRESMTRMDSSTKKLDHMLGVGKSPCDKRGLGYEDDKKISTSNKTIFVKSLKKEETSFVQLPRKKLEIGQSSNAQVKMGPRRQPQAQPPRVPQANIPQMAHKGKRPIMQPQAWKQPRPVQQRRRIEPFIHKDKDKAHDGKQEFLRDSCYGGRWICHFGDGSKKKVVGKGSISVPGLPSLSDALFVDGLKANLISISHLSDEGYSVLFSKNDCSILKPDGQTLLKGMRSSDNCYCLEARIVSNNVSMDEQVELWHERLGHMNFRDLRTLGKFECVRGLPKLGKKANGICGPCQQGKQTKSMHKKGKYLSTKEPLELLHMDLMGPMQTESLGGKRYIFVCVDDFSRFTWTYFLREKSETFDKFKMLCTKLQNEMNSNIRSIKRIRSDHGREFENASFESYCDS